MKFITLIILLIFISILTIFSQECDWIEVIGGNSKDQACKIKIDKDGNVYVVGWYFSKKLGFNNGDSLTNSGEMDVYFAKYNNQGKCLWTRQIKGGITPYDQYIAIDNYDNVFIAGSFNSQSIVFSSNISLTNTGKSDIYLAKYNSNGICLWANLISGNDRDNIYGIQTDNNNNIIIGGNFSSNLLKFGDGKMITRVGGFDGFLSSYDNNGKCLWANIIGGKGDDYLSNIDIDFNNNIYVIGYYYSNSIFLNNGKSITKKSNKIGSFLFKTNNEGSVQWAETFGGDKANDVFLTLSLDLNNNIYIGGTFLSDTLNFNNGIKIQKKFYSSSFLTKFDNYGICNWAKEFSGNGENIIVDLYLHENDDIYLVGNFRADSLYFDSNKVIGKDIKNDVDAFISKYNGEGICQWVEKIAGNNGEDYAESVAIDKFGYIYVAGVSYSDTLYIKDKSHYIDGEADGYIAKLSDQTVSVRNELIFKKLCIAPNPATDKITINLSDINSRVNPTFDGNALVEIYDVMGVLIHSTLIETKNFSSQQQQIDISNLAPGVYFVKIGDRVDKFVKY